MADTNEPEEEVKNEEVEEEENTLEEEEQEEEEEENTQGEEEGEEEEEEEEEDEDEKTKEEEKKEAAKPAPAPVPVKEKKKRPEPIPKDSKTFFKSRAKDPRRFDFTADGNLQVPEMRGQAPKVIPLSFYRSATTEETTELQQRKDEAIEMVEQSINEKVEALRDALQGWRETGLATPVIQLQRELAELDAKRSLLHHPQKWMTIFKSLDMRKIELDSKLGKKLGYEVAALRVRPFSDEDIHKPTEELPVEAPATKRKRALKKGPPETFFVFSGPEDAATGLLSPEKPIEFVYQGINFRWPLQAFEYHRTTMLKRGDVAKFIKAQKTTAGIRAFAAKVTGQIETPKELWTNILKALVAQHPEVGEKLRETEKATLVYANEKEKSAGIGLAPTDAGVTDKTKWIGPNILGQAWMAVRESLPAGELEKQSGGQILEDAAEAARAAEKRRGYFINMRRMNNQTH